MRMNSHRVPRRLSSGIHSDSDEGISSDGGGGFEDKEREQALADSSPIRPRREYEDLEHTQFEDKELDPCVETGKIPEYGAHERTARWVDQYDSTTFSTTILRAAERHGIYNESDKIKWHGVVEDSWDVLFGKNAEQLPEALQSLEVEDGSSVGPNTEEKSQNIGGNTSEKIPKVTDDVLVQKYKKHLRKTGGLDLAFSPATDAEAVAEAIRQVGAVKKFVWKNCGLDDKSVVTIITALSSDPGKVELLNLSGNGGLGRSSADAIAKLIRLKHVKCIKVKGCDLGQFHPDVIQPAMETMSLKFGTKIEYADSKVKILVDSKGREIHQCIFNYSISVPRGAVQLPTELRFTTLKSDPNFPKGTFPITPILKCFPSGLKFEYPVKICLPTWIVPKENSRGIPLVIFSRKSEKEKWVKQGEIGFGKNRTLEFSLWHFSAVGVGMEEVNIPQVDAMYCNMLFVNKGQGTYDSIQKVISWYGPDDVTCRQRTSMEFQSMSTLPPGMGSSPMRLSAGDRVSDSLRCAQENTVPVNIRPRNRRHVGYEDLIRDERKQLVYEVDLQTQPTDNERKIARLSHCVARNHGVQEISNPDPVPVSLTFSRTRPPELERRQYNLWGCVVDMGDAGVMGAEMPAQVAGDDIPHEE